jgi:hypothetical protein
MKYYYAVYNKIKKKIENFIERIIETKNRIKNRPSYNSLGITFFIFGAYIINYYFIKI